MNFSMTDYLQNRNYDLVSGASERGDTAVTNAGFLGQGKLLKAVDMADMLQQTAKIGGSATRYAGQQLGTASAVGGFADGVSSLAFGAFKGGHLGGGGNAFDYNDAGGFVPGGPPVPPPVPYP